MPSSGTTSASSPHARNKRASATGVAMFAPAAAAWTAASTASPSGERGGGCVGSL